MFLNNFEYFAPQTPEEALTLLDRFGDKAKVLAGGTDLFLLMKDKLLQPEYMIDINQITGFKGISYEPGQGATIGAATKIVEVERDAIIREKYYVLHQAASELGSVQVRTMATIGGNSCNASPAAETPTPLVALGAKVVLHSLSGKREMPLAEFILGNRTTALKPGELLACFILPEPLPRSAGRYAYIGLREAMEIDAVNMAVYIVLEDDSRTVKDLRLIMGSVAPRPLFSREVSALLTGKEPNPALIEKAAEAASGEASPISDIRGSAEYRHEMVKVLARRLLQETYTAAKEA
jgi:carbon-monoxide dehydrogenase medium subunit